MTAPLLRAEGMTAGYGKMAILHDVTLEVRPGEMVSVIGPNGAGKSTAFKTIVGFLRPTSGRVVFDGQDIAGLRPDQVLVRGLAYVPQGRIVFPQMTVLENLEMGAYIERDGARIRQALDRVCALFPILGERRSQKAGTMSGGEQQMVAIGRALMTTPKLIMLDEPSLGLSPKFVTLIFDKLTEMKRAGFTLMVVEQNAARALAVADRGYVLELGRNRFEGTGAGLARRSRGQAPLPRRLDRVYSTGFEERRTTVLMRIAWPSAIASAALAAVLIGILVLFQIPVAKSATTPQPAEPAPKGHAAATGHAAPTGKAPPRGMVRPR